jgi:hypothetical protein
MPSREETNETPGVSAIAGTRTVESREFLAEVRMLATFRTQTTALTPAAAGTPATGSARQQH